MIANPFAGTPQEPGWTMGFASGFMGPQLSDAPPSVIAPDLVDAFNQGRLDGQQAAIEGLVLSSSCMDATQDVPNGAETLLKGVHVVEGIAVAGDFLLAHIAHGFAGLAVLLFELAIPGGPPPATPEDVMPSLGRRFVDALNGMGIDSGDLFIAVGVDMQVVGCELLFSSLFKTIDQARQAADAMARPNHVIAHWRLEDSATFELVEAS